MAINKCLDCAYFLNCNKASEDITECIDYKYIRREIIRKEGKIMAFDLDDEELEATRELYGVGIKKKDNKKIKRLIHKTTMVAQWVFVTTNILCIGTGFFWISLLLWGLSVILFFITSD